MKQLLSMRSVQQGITFFKKRPLWRYTLILGLFLILAATVAAGNDSKTPYLVVDTYYPEKTTRYVTSWRLNMRYGPSTGYAIITKLKHDDAFSVVGQTADGSWLLAEVAGVQGWVWQEYTTAHPPTAPKGPQVFSLKANGSEAAPTNFHGYVTSYKLNLREGPSTDYKTILKLEHQEGMYVLGRDEAGNWLYVKTAYGLEGWVWSEFVQIKLTAPEVKSHK